MRTVARASTSFGGFLLVGSRALTTFPELKFPAALPALDFDWKEGVKPLFTARQMELHYTKHHKAYIDKFNAISKNEYDGKTVEEVITTVSGDASKTVLFNQAAQHFNHSFFWKCVTPGGKAITKALKDIIAKDFGTFENFQKKFEEAGVTNFGSGWTWLVYNPATATLQVDNTSNAGCPIASGLIPLFTADVWEHAYYKDFENRRADYLKELWTAADWSFVEAQYKRAVSK